MNLIPYQGGGSPTVIPARPPQPWTTPVHRIPNGFAPEPVPERGSQEPLWLPPKNTTVRVEQRTIITFTHNAPTTQRDEGGEWRMRKLEIAQNLVYLFTLLALGGMLWNGLVSGGAS